MGDWDLDLGLTIMCSGLILIKTWQLQGEPLFENIFYVKVTQILSSYREDRYLTFLQNRGSGKTKVIGSIDHSMSFKTRQMNAS